ncbi:putative alkaline shock family protein YloU [Streptosporangium album]|uniref:Putative alkaline shock family protein YloU n=1 Tax=Streptosporangium album TaxID=47479 RepID=A0A7W7W7N1_9ACTN|nr:putative alkaline shock family protein YloU [Streptosporangium album]
MTEANTVNTPPRGDETSVPRARPGTGGGQGSLVTSKGTTSIDGGVVAKIAGLAAREVSGVYDMGAGTARALGAVRGMVGGEKSAMQGVSVEVGERQAAADLDLVVEYGVAIPDVAAAVRRNVIMAVERMTGLEMTEVNIKVNDVHMPGQEKEGDKERAEELEQGPRVQ